MSVEGSHHVISDDIIKKKKKKEKLIEPDVMRNSTEYPLYIRTKNFF